MATKTISQLYLGAYAALATKQHTKYGNPTANTCPAPDHVPNVLETAIRDGVLATDQARKLASMLGKKAYGEVGLTPGVVCALIEKVCGFGRLNWHVKATLETRLCGY